MEIEFRDQKIEFVVGVEGIFYRLTFKRDGLNSQWILEIYDILKEKIVYLSKVDANIYPDSVFAEDIIKVYTSGETGPDRSPEQSTV